MAENMYGFEILVGPYAVAHLRLSQTLEGSGATISDRLKIYLADTLERPNATPPGGLTLTYKALTQEHEAARKVKNEGEILVCLGNPPYDREQRSDEDLERQRKGGWGRYGDQVQGAAKGHKQGEHPIFEDFLEPARKAGKGLNLQVIFNDYVYFWRWALWRLFEQQQCGGIISFITAASYLSGPGFVGVREVMRRTFDEMWILDLGGDNLGARKTPNVFSIQIPVAIAMGVRGKTPQPQKPANVWYSRIDGPTREHKLSTLESISELKDVEWLACPTDWHAPFLPQGKGAYFDWPRVTQLFPYHTAGAVYYRSWPIAETKEVLKARWKRLVSSGAGERSSLFKQSRDRKIDYVVNNPNLPGYDESSIDKLKTTTKEPNCIRYAFRSYDRQYAYYDFRLGDFLRPALHKLGGDKQLFLIVPDTLITGTGQAIIATNYIPDQHHFRGSFGGRDIIPLYRDGQASHQNITAGLLAKLAETYGFEPKIEDLAAYVYALLGGQTYTTRFWNELQTPGPRVPLTKTGSLFTRAAALGRRLIWLHTYAECYRGEGRGAEIPPGTAKSIKGMSSVPASYPEDFDYDPATKEIRVGDGRFGPVSPELWKLDVSGLQIISSWLSFRMKNRAGRKSSPLDSVRPDHWTPKMTDEFLELLWVLEASYEMEPELATTLDDIADSPCILASDLPMPNAAEMSLPVPEEEAGELLELMEKPAEHDD
jgi:predicted helicase